MGTLAVCFNITNLINTEDLVIMEGVAGGSVAAVLGITKVAAGAYLMFNLFTPPCFAAIGAMNSEIKSRKWLWAGIGLQFAVGYVVSFLTFFFGSLLFGNSLGAAWMPIVGWIVTLAIIAIFAWLIIKKKKELKAEYELKA